MTKGEEPKNKLYCEECESGNKPGVFCPECGYKLGRIGGDRYATKKKFNNKILIIGYGAVSQCTLPVLMDKIDVPLENITIIDFEDKSKVLKKYTDRGLKYVCKKNYQGKFE